MKNIGHIRPESGRTTHLTIRLSLFAGLIMSIAAAGCSSSETTQNNTPGFHPIPHILKASRPLLKKKLTVKNKFPREINRDL